ncbi:MAG: DUF4301 family protein [Thermoanaerobaculia bacterium]
MSETAPWTASDLDQMEQRGVSSEEIARQLEIFRRPAPVTRLERPCRLEDGIQQVSEGDEDQLLKEWRELARGGRLAKFVPASGAATRMFRDMKSALQGLTDGSYGTTANDSGLMHRLVTALPDFPFWERLQSVTGTEEPTFGLEPSREKVRQLLVSLLEPSGLGLATLPKGLIEFHRYESGPRSAFEEQLIEGTTFLAAAGGECRYHFTVSAEHLAAFEKALASAAPRIERETGMGLEVSFSTQSPATDTMAVDLENRPFRLANGELLFRPAGHGSLIENLSQIDGDVVFIKNIDNIAPQRQHEDSGRWKRLLAGKLGRLQRSIFALAGRLESACTEQLVEEALEFLRQELGVQVDTDTLGSGLFSRREVLMGLLDRPLRVCGVVRNEGQPGGGPFWVHQAARGLTCQIVETAQVDRDDPAQEEILNASTHFNPTDLVCGLKNRAGEPYELSRFIDTEMSFVTEKSHEGRPLRALERPGLWNGAMAGWNTVFVEVPLSTFTPVKSVFDLLQPEHRS